ncbi:DUF3122 domain-containing protein [Geitlerinema sp. PCC 9228]|jgi:hypothetical protein|uniref:DUF3122 domain-containing protein n=1 Tax=Geitlerinema sp. PCC 9228 TaxID=111611 RepID=UPI0008F9983D|nr:DUF3122 domain-containing protein [Geitlerinema sp. PCC 9228]
MWCKIRQAISWLLLLGALVLLALLATGVVSVEPAAADIRTAEVAPGEVFVKSFHSLRDRSGNSWQIVFFKRIHGGEVTDVNLRMVGFPELEALQHPAPLSITAKNGGQWQAEDVFTETAPVENIGQYDFRDLIFQLPTDTKLFLSPQGTRDRSVTLPVPPFIVDQWQTVASQQPDNP